MVRTYQLFIENMFAVFKKVLQDEIIPPKTMIPDSKENPDVIKKASKKRLYGEISKDEEVKIISTLDKPTPG